MAVFLLQQGDGLAHMFIHITRLTSYLQEGSLIVTAWRANYKEEKWQP